MICDRCGWFIPADCLCRPSTVDARRMRAEVSTAPDGWVSVRNSQRPARVAVFNPEEWSAFVAGVQNGEFGPAAGEAS